MNATDERESLYRRTLIVVVLSQTFGGAGLGAGITVGGLLAADMLGADSWAGVPATMFTLGSAAAAFMVGRLTQNFGRRRGLVFGYSSATVGAAGVVLAAVVDNILLMFLSMLVYGAGSATNLQARYAGTDLAAPHRRATAVSIVMVSTTFGAVAAPNMTGVMGGVAESFSIPRLAGPFLLSGAAFFLAGIVLFALLRPDPYVVAAKLPKQDASVGKRVFAARERGVQLGAVVMIVTQMVMIAIMTMTPVHMRHHGHGLGATGLVIGVHIGAMYLPSLVTGVLVDSVGRIAMAIAGAITLAVAGVVAATADPASVFVLSVALGLLGLGWNIGLISGTALIADSAPVETRAKTQGKVDLLLALSGASGGALSGIVVAGSSYQMLALMGGAVGLALIPIVLVSRN